MKLYTTAGGPNPRRVEIFAAEKGIQIPSEEVSIMKGEHKLPEYRKISPLSQVPAMTLDDGRILTESVAICRYLEHLHPEPPLFGADAWSQAVVEMWQRRLELLFLLPVAMAFRHQHPAMKQLEHQLPEWGKISHERASKMMVWLDGQLAGKEFIAGDSFSIADITGVVALDFGAAVARLPIPENLKNLASWHKRLSERPSVRGAGG